MNRPILALTLFAVASAALGAQQASPSNPYEGVSNPPPDDTIVTAAAQQEKPPAGKPANAQPAVPAPAPAASEPQPAASSPLDNAPSAGTDDGVVQGASPAAQPAQPALMDRSYASDPDGDIVHPAPLRPGELAEGTTIRVHLLDRLSTTASEKGEVFRTKVASDVWQDGKVSIPAGSEIDGVVAEASRGHLAGHGAMRLRPETVILPSGTRYTLHADVTGTPGSETRVGSEGAINPGSRVRRDEFEYGGAVGAGAVTGGLLAGPVGAVTGGLIGAGAVTAHLLVSHPQATLESGTTILFTLTEPLYLVPAGAGAN